MTHVDSRESAMRRHPSYRGSQTVEPEQGQHDDEIYEEGARCAALDDQLTELEDLS